MRSVAKPWSEFASWVLGSAVGAVAASLLLATSGYLLDRYRYLPDQAKWFGASLAINFLLSVVLYMVARRLSRWSGVTLIVGILPVALHAVALLMGVAAPFWVWNLLLAGRDVLAPIAIGVAGGMFAVNRTEHGQRAR